MDMFLIALLILVAVVFSSIWKMIEEKTIKSKAIYPVLLFLVLLPALYNLREGETLELPDREITASILDRVQIEAQLARLKGEVLFMDQR